VATVGVGGVAGIIDKSLIGAQSLLKENVE